jgi:hypothetical protein
MYHYFTKDTIYAVLFREIVSVNYWNLIKIVKSVLKEILGPIWRVQIFGGRMFIFTGQQPMIDKQLNIRYEWNLCKHSYTSEAHFYTYIHTYIHTDRIQNTPFCIHRDSKSVKPSKSWDQFLFTVTISSHTLYATYMRIILICSKSRGVNAFSEHSIK